MTYTPGLHLLVTAHTPPASTLLLQHDDWKDFIRTAIARHGLTEVGASFHDFPGGGFTGVICLTESHISIHTWPEYGLFTYDVFLSNFRRNNDTTTQNLLDETLSFFQVTDHQLTSLRR